MIIEKKVVYKERAIRKLMNDYPGEDFGEALKLDAESKNDGYLLISFEETCPDPIKITAYMKRNDNGV